MGSGCYNAKISTSLKKVVLYTEMKTSILPGYLFIRTGNIKAHGVYTLHVLHES